MVSASVYYFMKMYGIIQTLLIHTQFQLRMSDVWLCEPLCSQTLLLVMGQQRESTLHHACTITVNWTETEVNYVTQLLTYQAKQVGALWSAL